MYLYVCTEIQLTIQALVNVLYLFPNFRLSYVIVCMDRGFNILYVQALMQQVTTAILCCCYYLPPALPCNHKTFSLYFPVRCL